MVEERRWRKPGIVGRAIMTGLFFRARGLIIDGRYADAAAPVRRAFALQGVKPPSQTVNPTFNIMAALVAYNLNDRDVLRSACEIALWQLEPGAQGASPRKRARALYLQYYCKVLLEFESDDPADRALSARYPIRFDAVRDARVARVYRESFPVWEAVPSEKLGAS
jgi:hypothetical protein